MGHGLVWKGGRRNSIPWGVPRLAPSTPGVVLGSGLGITGATSLKGMSKQEIPSCERGKEVGIPAKRKMYAKGVLSCQQIRVKLQSPRAFK